MIVLVLIFAYIAFQLLDGYFAPYTHLGCECEDRDHGMECPAKQGLIRRMGLK